MLLKISCGSWVLDFLASVASINLSKEAIFYFLNSLSLKYKLSN